MSYKRVNKPEARKLYNNGVSIFLIPCKCSFTPPEEKTGMVVYIFPIEISIFTCDTDANKFDRTVRDFEWKYCNAECGYYSHYYVRESDIENQKMCDIMCS